MLTLKSDFSWSVQDFKWKFPGLSYLINYNNLASSYQILRWVMPKPQKTGTIWCGMTLLRQLSFNISSYSDIYQQKFWKIPSNKSIFKVGSSRSFNKLLEKYLWKNSHFRKLFYIYEQNLWNAPVKEIIFFRLAWKVYFWLYFC